MITDASGEIGPAIHLRDEASKGRSGRVIPLNGELRLALIAWRPAQLKASPFVVSTERSDQTSAQAVVNLFSRWYNDLAVQWLFEPQRPAHFHYSDGEKRFRR